MLLDELDWRLPTLGAISEVESDERRRETRAGWGPCQVCIKDGYSTVCGGYTGSGDTNSSSCTTCGHAFGNHR